MGEDFSARKKEVNILTDEGFAGYLIIPAYYKIYRIDSKGSTEEFISRSEFSNKVQQNKLLSQMFENTHLEIIETKLIMFDYKINSAVFVSSPYHMRRIKIIASKVFNRAEGRFYFMPTRFEKAPANFWELSSKDWKNVWKEYAKIIWFFIYINFIK